MTTVNLASRRVRGVIAAGLALVICLGGVVIWTHEHDTAKWRSAAAQVPCYRTSIDGRGQFDGRLSAAFHPVAVARCLYRGPGSGLYSSGYPGSPPIRQVAVGNLDPLVEAMERPSPRTTGACSLVLYPSPHLMFISSSGQVFAAREPRTRCLAIQPGVTAAEDALNWQPAG
jgi:hypothetical protein